MRTQFDWRGALRAREHRAAMVKSPSSIYAPRLVLVVAFIRRCHFRTNDSRVLRILSYGETLKTVRLLVFRRKPGGRCRLEITTGELVCLRCLHSGMSAADANAVGLFWRANSDKPRTHHQLCRACRLSICDRRSLLATRDLAKRESWAQTSLSRECLAPSIEQKVQRISAQIATRRGSRGIANHSNELQTEMERMARQPRQPDVLGELFEALGNDPFVIAECLARPIWVGQLARSLNRQARCKRLSRRLTPFTSQIYKLPEISFAECADNGLLPGHLNAPTARGGHTATWTGSEMIIWAGLDGNLDSLNTAAGRNPVTDSWTATTSSTRQMFDGLTPESGPAAR